MPVLPHSEPLLDRHRTPIYPPRDSDHGRNMHDDAFKDDSVQFLVAPKVDVMNLDIWVVGPRAGV